MPREGFFESGGVRLHYLDWGGVGAPMVLLAGLGDSAQQYRGLAPKLANRFRVVGLTRRGHGRSDRPDSGYDLDTLVEDVRRFQESLEIERAILVGHSFAGLEMPRFAVRYPERVEALVFLDALFPRLDPEPDLSGDPIWSAVLKGGADGRRSGLARGLPELLQASSTCLGQNLVRGDRSRFDGQSRGQGRRTAGVPAR